MAEKGPRYRVALAEDVPGIRQLLVKFIERLGHSVVCAASNGAELVDRCRNLQVDIVVTDLDMPVMDGLAAAQELRDLQPDGLPIVLISGHPDADHVVLEHEPVNVRISKPFSLQSLRHAIELALSQANKAPNVPH